MNWKKVAVHPHATIKEAITIIDMGGAQIALVVDDRDVLVGTVTDGDVRRGILKGIGIHECVEKIYNTKPFTMSDDEDDRMIAHMMRDNYFKQIPIVDKSGKVVKLELLKNLLKKERRLNWAVIMAGGLGTRLKPLTDSCPKPLLKIAGKPILEIILKRLSEQGINRVYIAVNYKGDMISSYFGDGSKFGVQIEYIHESNKLGTAGALSLLPEVPMQPLLVMNGDLLTGVNFSQMLEFHERHSSNATMGVIEYDVQVPYGVVKLQDHHLKSLDEKPVQTFFINAGIYILEPSILKLIPHNTQFDMTELFQNIFHEKQKAVAFPIREFWLDIGKPDDFSKANEIYSSMCDINE